MRLICTLSDEQAARRFSTFLDSQKVPHLLEGEPNTDWGSSDYGTSKWKLWVYEEDDMPRVQKWYESFAENPHAAEFEIQHHPVQPPVEPVIQTSTAASPIGPITRFLLILCSLLYLSSLMFLPDRTLPPQLEGFEPFLSPIDQMLMFDYPKFYSIFGDFLTTYGAKGLKDPNSLPQEGQQLYQQLLHTPYWQGIYKVFLDGKNAEENVPMFEKIREGEVWRLVTPILLHGGLLHLLFNMLWLLVLGKQIEYRLTASLYLLMIVVIAVISNTAQYLMSGANFLGFSGVLCGMLTFIWMRQHHAPWEGYQLDRSTLIFMLAYVLGMAFLQLVSFFVEWGTQFALSPGVANTAHVAGGIVGYVLGKTNLLRWRHS